MKTYLELEGKLGPKPQSQPQLQSHTSTPYHYRNSLTRKTLVPKKVEKKRKAKAPVKRRFKVSVIAQPMPINPTLPMNPIPPAEPTPTVTTSTATTQMPVVKSAATSIPVTVYDLAQGKFEGIPYPTGRPQVEENPSAPSCNMPQQRQQPKATPTVTTLQTREDTQWPNTVPVSTNLFEARASWPIPPIETPAVVKMEKTEALHRVAAIPHALVLNEPQNNRPVKEKCTRGPHCPICAKEEGTKDWNGDRPENQQRTHYPQSPQHPQAYDIPDRFSQQIKLEKEWNEKRECLNKNITYTTVLALNLTLTLSQNTNTKQ